MSTPATSTPAPATSTPATSTPAGATTRTPAPLSNPEREVEIPHGVRVVTAWSWRFLVIVAAAAVIAFAVVQLRLIVVPVAIALLVTALIIPLVDRLAGFGLPRGAAAGITLVVVFLAVFGLLGLVGQQIASGFPSLSEQVGQGIDQIHNWLVTGPLNLTNNQILNAIEAGRISFEQNRQQITQGALRFGTTLGHLVAGFFLVIFATIFFLYQGGRIWAWVVHLFPSNARARADGAGRRAWSMVTSFVRATVLVAFVDAVGITAVALLLQVPLALPIGVLVFLAAFIPIVGAVLSGIVAVLVALVAHGAVVALLMLAGVLAVQQLESNVLQPLVLGKLVALHPLAVILAIAAGSYLAGILGALLAVPVVAAVNGIAQHLANGDQSAATPSRAE